MIAHRHLATAATVLAVLALLATVLVGQYALDHNLQRGSGGINQPTRRAPLSRSVYTVNRRTGGMQHNRANAFNDSAYNIYQRYTLDRNRYFDPKNPGGPRSSTKHRPAAPTGPTRLDRPSYSVAPAAPRRRASNDLARSARRSVPRSTASALKQPRYSSLPSYSRSSS
ncbi:MAG: hypothetical protein GY715_05715 [Planctomycetes bacterium]|nr:hypothetical protein [Planctomycetota bacterium]